MLRTIKQTARPPTTTAATVAGCLLAVLTSIAFLVASPSLADAAPAASTTASTTIGWPALGLPNSIDLYQSAGTQSYTLPVPAGLHPSTLTGTLSVADTFGAGSLYVESSGNVLGSVPLPSGSSAAGTVHFTVSLAGAKPHGATVAITFMVRGGKVAVCSAPPQLSLSSLSTTYTGVAAAPATIDQFFPSIVRRLTIYTEPDPTQVEQQAVLTVTGELVARYPQLLVSVRALPGAGKLPSVAPSAVDRTIVIRQAARSGVTIVAATGGGRILLFSGGTVTLSRQISLFATSLSRLAHATSAVVQRASTAATRPDASSYTFSQLGISAGASVLGQSTLSFSLDQQQLGGPLNEATVHLFGGYTPVSFPEQGTMSATVAALPLANVRLGSSGRLDTSFRIPHQLLTRTTTVQLTVGYSPGTACLPLTPSMTFTVYPWSYVTVSRATSPAGGFPALPTAFLHGMDVALQDNSIPELNDAALTVAGMQSLSSAALNPRLIPFHHAATATVGTVVVADSNGVQALGLHPPLGTTPTELSAAFPGHPKIGLHGGAGAIESFADARNNRTVLLISTTGGWSLIDALWSAIAGSGWYSLTGDTYATVNGGPATDLAIGTTGISTFTPPPAPSTGWTITFVLVGAIALAIIAFSIGIWWATRRRRTAD